jgi:Ca2+-binding EF-hand superfamily protein
VNDDGSLSLGELSLYINGATQRRQKRLQELDPRVKQDMIREIDDLFKSFDEDGDGQITADEIYRTLMSFGMRKTIDQCKEMIRSAAGQHAATLDRNTFRDFKTSRRVSKNSETFSWKQTSTVLAS